MKHHLPKKSGNSPTHFNKTENKSTRQQISGRTRSHFPQFHQKKGFEEYQDHKNSEGEEKAGSSQEHASSPLPTRDQDLITTENSRNLRTTRRTSFSARHQNASIPSPSPSPSPPPPNGRAPGHKTLAPRQISNTNGSTKKGQDLGVQKG